MGTANIYINGLIGSIKDNDGNLVEQGTELIDVIEQFNRFKDALEYNVFINSQGGVVNVGYQIHDFIKSIKKPINTIGHGQVASIATVIFMAGNKRKLKENTNFLVHLPMVAIDGYVNSQDIDLIKADLEAVNSTLLNFYKKETGLSSEALMPLLANETSLTIDQAISLGFATEKYTEIQAVAYLDNKKELEMTPENKSWLENLIAGAVNKIVGKSTKKGFQTYALKKIAQIVNLETTDANGALIVFPEVADGVMPVVGDKATIDGVAADGEYLMPDGTTYVFEAGELKQIVEAAAPVDNATEIENMVAEIASLIAENQRVKTESINQITNLKAQIVNKFDGGGAGDSPAQDPAPTKRTNFK
jgi:ATP-dependent protease ClpP protease subunit